MVKQTKKLTLSVFSIKLSSILGIQNIPVVLIIYSGVNRVVMVVIADV